MDFLLSPLSRYIRVTRDRLPGLQKLRIACVRDMLYHFPARYTDQSTVTPIASITDNAPVVIFGRITDIELRTAFSTNKKMVVATIEDINGDRATITWFSQIFIAKTLTPGQLVRIAGQASVKKQQITIINPSYEKVSTLPIDYGNSLFNTNNKQSSIGESVYPESRGVSSLWLRHAIKTLLQEIINNPIPDPIPQELLEKYNLPDINSALRWIHAPANEQQSTAARKRFSFEYIFIIQLHQQKIRSNMERIATTPLSISDQKFEQLLQRLPFTLTNGQRRVIDTIRQDIARTIPMGRLLEGDVGSGKTAIASIIAGIATGTSPTEHIVSSSGVSKTKTLPGTMQVAYMAPTEVLAAQLFETFITFFSDNKTPIVLLTGKSCRKFPSKLNPHTWTPISRAQALKWVKNGEIPIVIGTHALISKGVSWENLGLVIIDEQHRFGTNQRGKLAGKDGLAPHFLSMSATPIPRTLALTLYGDLDISVLDEVPPGRLPVITTIVSPDKRSEVYEKIREQLSAGRQAYVICPRINDQDDDEAVTIQMRSAVGEAKRLGETEFQKWRIAAMHSKLGKQEKESVMNDFANHDIDILVSTSVVEVGVNVPNATIMIIEGSERFGLSQLHQLRGRVMRSSHQPYCYLFTETKSEKTSKRLSGFLSAKNGFELAEIDLHNRGAGDLLGARQWGITDIGMEAIKNIKLVEAARTEAKHIITTDPNLTQYPLLQSLLDQHAIIPHLE